MKYSYKAKGRRLEIPAGVSFGSALVLRKLMHLFGMGVNANKKIKSLVKNGLAGREKREIPTLWKLIDSLSFKKIFGLWVALVFLFGFIFFFIHSVSPENGLVSFKSSSEITILSTIYFSFVTATSTGFGDITPVGISRVISIIEVINTLIILGIVVSKLVSFKQDIILNEIYGMSIDEKVNSLRSALYLSTSDIGRMTEKLIVEGRISKMTVESFWTIINVMHENIMEMKKIICIPNERNEFVKNIDNFQIELLINSITISLSKISELLTQLNYIPYNWRSGKNVESIRAILSTVDNIKGYYAFARPPRVIINRVNEMKLAAEELEKRM